MPVHLELAANADAAAIAALRLAVARQLTAEHGVGTWSFAAETETSVRADLVTSRVMIARGDGGLVATLRLSPRMPWLGPIDYFSHGRRPLYLTSMAVAPKAQR